MRILHVLHDFLPMCQAGVELYAEWVTRALARRHEVAILHGEEDPGVVLPTLRRGVRDGVHIFRLAHRHQAERFEDTYASERIARILEPVLDEFAPDVVHVHHLANLSIGFIACCSRRGIPVVMTVHDYWMTCANGGQRFHPEMGRCPLMDAQRCARCTAHLNRAGLFVRSLYRRRRAASSVPGSEPERWSALAAAKAGQIAARAARAMLGVTGSSKRRVELRWQAMRGLAASVDRFLVPSDHLLEDLIQFGIPRDSLCKLTLGIPVERFRRRRLPERARRFAYAGSLTPHKGVHVLLEAFARLGEPAELLVAGPAPSNRAYALRLHRLARSHPVHFVGEIPNSEFPGFLEGVDCLVTPSIWRENAPMVVQEAFAAGIPVVASRLGGYVELLESGGGLLCDPGDPNAFRLALQDLARTPGRLRELAERIPPIKPLDQHVSELLAIYDERIRERGVATRPLAR